MSEAWPRTARTWIHDLQSEGPVRDAALTDLRRVLVGGLARAMSGRGVDDAFLEDTVQDALLKILGHLDRFEFRSRFTTWAMTIATREAITEMRRLRWKDVSLDAIGDGVRFQVAAPDDADGRTTEDRLALSNLVARLERLVAEELTDRQRVAMNAELAGMPQAEIARRTGSNRNAVYKLMHDARKKLKRGLERMGYSANDVLAVLGSSG